MSATSQFTVTSVSRTPIKPVGFFKTLTIKENPGVGGYPTSDYTVFKPIGAANGVRIPAGDMYVLTAADSSAEVQMIAGTTTFDQDEASS